MSTLDIIIFDGSLKTTAFINRLVSGLINRGHNVHILGFNDDTYTKIKNANYVGLGNVDNKFSFLIKSLKLAIVSMFRKNGFKRFLNVLTALIKSDSKTIKKLNFLNGVHSIKPDIIHVQWPNLLSFCEDIMDDSEYKIVLSQRGYHINVRPFIDNKTKENFRNWFSRVDGFHSVSRATQRKGQAIFNTKNKIDRVIYSGIDLNAFNFNKKHIKKPVLKLLSVGRPHWIKGYTSFLEVCKVLKSKNIKFEYTIVGANGNEELVYLINQYNLTDSVKLTDRVNSSKVYELMTNASLLILPSLEEGLANVVIEAMAIGLPVISSDCGGMPELVINNKTGWLVPLNDVNGFIRAIENFNQLSENHIQGIIVAARKKVEEQHNIEHMIINFEKLYNSLLNQ